MAGCDSGADVRVGEEDISRTATLCPGPWVDSEVVTNLGQAGAGWGLWASRCDCGLIQEGI